MLIKDIPNLLEITPAKYDSCIIYPDNTISGTYNGFGAFIGVPPFWNVAKVIIQRDKNEIHVLAWAK